MKVLIIEDNAELSVSIQRFLTREGYICETALTCAEAREKLVLYSYDCILLDIMLPDGNGLQLLDFIRRENVQSSILITSAKNALDDKIEGLDGGADDYLTKPFHLPELHARLRAIFRRNKLNGGSQIVFNEISLDTDKLEARVNETVLDLTKKEFDLLLYFMVNKNRVVSRQSIATHLWGDYIDNMDNFDFVYQHLKNLRKKIAAAGGADYIDTIYGLGYKFNASGNEAHS